MLSGGKDTFLVKFLWVRRGWKVLGGDFVSHHGLEEGWVAEGAGEEGAFLGKV